MFIKLPDEMTAEQYVAAVRSGIAFPEGALDYSGLALTSPGQEADFWLRLDPGNYVLFCWFKGHSADLPAHELLVVDDNAADNTPPQADVVVKLVDFRFDVIGEFKEGAQIVQFDTPGPSMHEADIFVSTTDWTEEIWNNGMKTAGKAPLQSRATVESWIAT